MKRPTIEDTRATEGAQSIGGKSICVYTYSKMQDEYIDYLEKKIKEAEQLAYNKGYTEGEQNGYNLALDGK